jgi:hypothetical protein
MFTWADTLGLHPVVQGLRTALAPLAPAIPPFVLHSFPDGAWVYAYTACLARVWGGRSAWLALPGTLGIGGELGQFLGVVPGTFDPVDLTFMLFAAFLATPSGVRP